MAAEFLNTLDTPTSEFRRLTPHFVSRSGGDITGWTPERNSEPVVKSWRCFWPQACIRVDSDWGTRIYQQTHTIVVQLQIETQKKHTVARCEFSYHGEGAETSTTRDNIVL
jgi:hypothetical protein